jgi:ankyrin repeat protein
MNKDEIWERIKDDETEVYGQSMLDMFLKTTKNLEARHYKELPADKRRLPDPEIRLRNADTVDESEKAIKDGAEGVYKALDAAASRGHLEVVEFLVNKGLEILGPALNYAAAHGHLKVVEFLMNRGVGANLKGTISMNEMELALDHAAERGHFEIVKFLVGRGLNPNGALFRAAHGGQFDVVKFLVEKGADDLDEALYHASRHGHEEVADFLKSKGAK